MNEPCPQCGQPPRPNQAPGACPACLVRLAMGKIPEEPLEAEALELQSIGPYKLLRKVGEGGFGTVHAAEQAEPIRREVAIKVLKLGMDTVQVVARFRAEQQALAALDHPNIAQVHDAGTTETGRPYFVMELIDGVPLTEYCDAQRLSIQERLRVFLPVCQAIAYAHQQGILHRDLKSSNILVSDVQGEAVPKVIDFGIAKAIGDRAADSTMLTQEQQFVGTPAAMSPEQAAGERSIDARADVYALGVLLYQLLTGQTPLDESATKETSHHELLRLIQEKDASRPSVRVRKLSPERLLKIASLRDERPDTLAKKIAGDLDWIARKALLRDREQRYPTPLHLAEDLERHLQHRVIEARPPTFSYVVKSFACRHTAACVTAGFIILGLGVGLVAILRSSANAKRQAQRSEALANSLADILFTKSTSNGYKADYTVRELIMDSEGAIRERLGPFPDLEARVLAQLGNALLGSENLGRAIPVLERACILSKAQFTKESPEWLESACLLTEAYDQSHRYEEAFTLGREAYEVCLALNGPNHLETARAMAHYAYFRWRRASKDDVDEIEKSMKDLSKAASLCEAHDSPLARRVLAGICIRLFRHAISNRDPALAETYARKRLKAASGLEHPESVDIEMGRVMLATALREQGRLDEAEEALTAALAAATKWHGAQSPHVTDIYLEYGKLYRRWGKLDQAESMVRKALTLAIRLREANPKLEKWAREALEELRAARKGDL